MGIPVTRLLIPQLRVIGVSSLFFVSIGSSNQNPIRVLAICEENADSIAGT
jgi:hypothetical protein